MPSSDPRPDPMTMTVHDLPDLHGDDAKRNRGRWNMLLIVLACAAPVLASYFAFYVMRPTSTTNYGTLITTLPEPDASLTLIDASGQVVSATSLKGQWLLVVVAGGACDAACEQALWLQRQLRETLGREKDRVDRVWLVHDEVPVRAAVLAAMQGGWVLRASPQALGKWLQADEGRVLQDHFYLVNPMGQWMMRFPAQPDAKKVKRDLDRLLRAAASWDRAGRDAL